MRKTTLTFICFSIAWTTIFSFRELLGWYGFGWIATSQIGTTTIASLLIAPLLAIALKPVDDWLLAKRMEKGRDIRAEERHESEHGFISLTPKSDD